MVNALRHETRSKLRKLLRRLLEACISESPLNERCSKETSSLCLSAFADPVDDSRNTSSARITDSSRFDYLSSEPKMPQINKQD